MTVKHLFHFGIEDPRRRLIVWGCASVLGAACAYFFWPFGLIPFVLLFARSLWEAKKAL